MCIHYDPVACLQSSTANNETAKWERERDDKRNKMFFLSKLVVISSLMALHTAEGKIGLTANHQQVNPLTTKNFTLNCTYEGRNKQVVSLQLSKVIRKGTRTGVLKDLITMNENSKIHILSPSPYVKYTGGIYRKDKVYLSGTWYRVPICFGGIYKCRVNVINRIGQIESLNRQIRVDEKTMTFVHAKAAIKELQKSDHILQEWKERMILAFRFLERATMKTFYSKVYKNKFYIAYKHEPGFVRYAEAFCQARGGYLAELNDFNEWKFVASFTQSIHSSSIKADHYYVSGRKNLANNKYYWPRMGKWAPAYFNWNKGQPKSHGSFPCVWMDRHSHWRITNNICNAPGSIWNVAFICEMPKSQ